MRKLLTGIHLFPIIHTSTPYSLQKGKGDLAAAINVALLAFPQGMAFALIAGLPIEYGLYGSVIAAIVGPLFAGSPYITQGPTNATSVMIVSYFAAMGISEMEKLALLPLLLVMIGLFLVMGAYLRVANLIQFISRSVVIGYITAAACLIVANQMKKMLDVTLTEPATTFVEVVVFTIKHAPEASGASILLSLISLAIYIFLRKKFPKLPNVAITLVSCSFIAHFGFTRLGYELEFLSSFSISEYRLHWPAFSLESIRLVSGPAFAIAMLAVLEGTSIGKSMAAQRGSRLDGNQEMFSIGMANLSCGIFGGMPSSGSLTRSMLNISSGALTPLASVMNGLICLLGIFLFSDYISYIPQASLAVIVVGVGWSLFNKHAIKIAFKATPADAIVFVSTVAVGLLVALDSAIYVGMIISIILFLRQASHPEMVEYCFKDEQTLSQLESAKERNTPSVSIVHVEGNIFFGASELFRDQVRRACEDPQLKILILKMRNAYNLDATSVMALEELVVFMNKEARYLIISEARTELITVLKRSGIYNLIGKDFIFADDPENATASTARALRRAQELLGDVVADVSISYTRNHK